MANDRFTLKKRKKPLATTKIENLLKNGGKKRKSKKNVNIFI